jgi:hypothetical protein
MLFTTVVTSLLCPPWIAKSLEEVARQFHPSMKLERLSIEF